MQQELEKLRASIENKTPDQAGNVLMEVPISVPEVQRKITKLEKKLTEMQSQLNVEGVNTQEKVQQYQKELERKKQDEADKLQVLEAWAAFARENSPLCAPKDPNAPKEEDNLDLPHSKRAEIKIQKLKCKLERENFKLSYFTKLEADQQAAAAAATGQQTSAAAATEQQTEQTEVIA